MAPTIRLLRVAPLLAILAALLAGCEGPAAADCAPPSVAERVPEGPDAVYVLGRGWHTEIGVPADRLAGKLAVFRSIFPGAREVMFGYGKRTFMVARADRVSEYVLGPLPGPALIEAVGLNATPPEAYGGDGVIALTLPPGGMERLSAFIWNDLQHDGADEPLLVAPGRFPGSLFYAARSGYDLFHTCNTWVAEALHAAGLPVATDWLIFSGQTMARAENAAQCRVR